jgi:hypothetical protein
LDAIQEASDSNSKSTVPSFICIISIIHKYIPKMK